MQSKVIITIQFVIIIGLAITLIYNDTKSESIKPTDYNPKIVFQPLPEDHTGYSVVFNPVDEKIKSFHIGSYDNGHPSKEFISIYKEHPSTTGTCGGVIDRFNDYYQQYETIMFLFDDDTDEWTIKTQIKSTGSLPTYGLEATPHTGFYYFGESDVEREEGVNHGICYNAEDGSSEPCNYWYKQVELYQAAQKK